MHRQKSESANPRLKQHKNGYWYIYWTKQDSNGTARTARQTTRSKDRGLAELTLADFTQKLNAPSLPEDDLRIKHLVDRYMAYMEKKASSDETVDFARQQQAVDRFKPFFGNLRIEHLSDDLLEQYGQQRLNLSTGEPVANDTLRRELCVLRAALNWAHHKNIISEKPPMFGLPKKSPPRQRYLTHKEYENLLKNIKSYHILIWTLLAYHTAARAISDRLGP